jgi:UDPglucose 6-dehydrogenase
VARLSAGECPILEHGLPELLAEGLASGRLDFGTDNGAAAAAAEFTYLCVPTPQGDDGSADLSYIQAAATEIGPHVEAGSVVVNKSTVPVGSTLVVERALGRSDVFVVSNPEFLREGTAVHDFLHPDRVVVGAADRSAAMRVAELYDGLGATLIITDPPSAETIKYAANAFLATKLSFVNAVAAVCEAVGADMNDVVVGIGSDRRIGHEFLKPGPGWGGSCFVGDETVLVRRDGRLRHLRFDQLFVEVERAGADGWEVLSWAAGAPSPELHAVSRFTARPYDGDVVDITTKMGRRLTVTADHPMVVCDGTDDATVEVVAAGDLRLDHWLPIAQGAPLVLDDPANPGFGRILDACEPAGIAPESVIVRLDDLQRALLAERRSALPAGRRQDATRCGTLRLSELHDLGIPTLRGRFGTATNGTYVPDAVPFDEPFWRMVGLYLAEGHVAADGARRRVCWSFAPVGEDDLVEEVTGFWRSFGVKVAVRRAATAMNVSISSRLLAAWFGEVLGLGSNAYVKRLPDAIWSATEADKRALLRGLWDGDGSWSLVSGGPSVVLEYGTVSRALADGMLRLLGDLGVVARLKVGRTAKSTCDTFWLTISGADQVEDVLWLLPPAERADIGRATGRQSKRIAPTGYRRLGEKHAAWVRVTGAARRPFDGTVFSLSVPGPHTVVATHGLVAHNCFPKDSRALVRIAEDAGYRFDLLEGVIAVNLEQFDRVAARAVEMVGGSVAGASLAVWGLTFKARTDDLRDSPSLEVIARLRAAGAHIRAYDPSIPDGVVPASKEAVLDGIEVVADPYDACDGAALLLVLTEWDEFRWLDIDALGDRLAERRVLDGRNLLDREALVRRGFTYRGIGRT